MAKPTLQLLHMAAPDVVHSAPVLGEPFGQLHVLAVVVVVVVVIVVVVVVVTVVVVVVVVVVTAVVVVVVVVVTAVVVVVAAVLVVMVGDGVGAESDLLIEIAFVVALVPVQEVMKCMQKSVSKNVTLLH